MKTRKISFPRHYRISAGRLDMAPLVDVVLNLLVYFMLTSSFIMQPGLHIRLPEARTTESPVPAPLVVTITADSRLLFEEREVTLEELEQLVVARGKAGPFEILLRGDERARHGLVVKVLDLARLAGAGRLVIATTPEL